MMERRIKIKYPMREYTNNYFLFFIFCFTIFKYNVYALDLTIDNRLFVTPSDCYKRIIIGSRLENSSITTTIEASSVSDCETACSANGTSCVYFSFGVGARGNGTCMLGQNITQSTNPFTADTDYDIYAKGRVSLLGCRTSKDWSKNISSNLLLPIANNKNKINSNLNNKQTAPILTINNNLGRIFGNSNLLNTFGNSFFTKRINQTNLNINPIETSSATPSFKSDARTRILDILINKKQNNYKNNYLNKINELDNNPLFHQDDFESYYLSTVKDIQIPAAEEKKNKELTFFGQKIINPQNNFYTFRSQKELLPPVIDDFNYPTALEYYSDFGKKINDQSNFEFQSQFHNDDNYWINSGYEINQNPSEDLEEQLFGSSGVELKGEKGKNQSTLQ